MAEETQEQQDEQQQEEGQETEGSSDAGSRDEETQRRMKELEEDPPKDLSDWPDDELKYETFGGPEGGHGYEEGPEAQLGPSGLRYHEDGSIEIQGEKVDNPDDYRSDPIPGGPTDPEARGPESGDQA